MQEKVISRIAPTPSGYLHVGNVYNFLLTWLLVRSRNGHLFLRIDDLDQARVRLKYVDEIFRILDWLHLDYDEGPSGSEDFLKNHRQAFRKSQYENAIYDLAQSGKTFGCKCSRKKIQSITPDGQYPGTCKGLHLSPVRQNIALRVDTANADEMVISEENKGRITMDLNKHIKDFVIQRKDGLPAYQVVSLMDDMAMNVNYIVRGTDLLPSSFAQMFLADLLGLSHFKKMVFRHHKLLTDVHDQKLSKSANAEAVMTMYSSKKIFNSFAKWMGWNGRPENPKELLEEFSKV